MFCVLWFGFGVTRVLFFSLERLLGSSGRTLRLWKFQTDLNFRLLYYLVILVILYVIILWQPNPDLVQRPESSLASAAVCWCWAFCITQSSTWKDGRRLLCKKTVFFLVGRYTKDIFSHTKWIFPSPSSTCNLKCIY